jgi:hypothetical protein
MTGLLISVVIFATRTNRKMPVSFQKHTAIHARFPQSAV